LSVLSTGPLASRARLLFSTQPAQLRREHPLDGRPSGPNLELRHLLELQRAQRDGGSTTSIAESMSALGI
jgi:hypothetical protein